MPNCVLGRGTQRRALPCNQSEEMETLNISFPPLAIEPTTYRVYSRTLVPLRHDWTQVLFMISSVIIC